MFLDQEKVKTANAIVMIEIPRVFLESLFSSRSFSYSKQFAARLF